MITSRSDMYYAELCWLEKLYSCFFFYGSMDIKSRWNYCEFMMKQLLLSSGTLCNWYSSIKSVQQFKNIVVAPQISLLIPELPTVKLSAETDSKEQGSYYLWEHFTGHFTGIVPDIEDSNWWKTTISFNGRPSIETFNAILILLSKWCKVHKASQLLIMATSITSNCPIRSSDLFLLVVNRLTIPWKLYGVQVHI